MAIPIFKFFEFMIQGIYMDECPWVDGSDSLKYLDMARVSILTLAHTVEFGILFSVSAGWGITVMQFNRN